MGVELKELELHDFRSHRIFRIDEPQRLIIIIGANATGKTNIIEAIQLVSMLESFRNPRWQDLVADTKETTSVKARFSQNGRLLDMAMTVQGGRRSYSLNGKRKTAQELRGIVPAVVFVPDDLMLVKTSSEARRRLLDDIGKQLSSTYATILSDYQRIVRQRNAILKGQRKDGVSVVRPAFQESWDDSLISLGSLLFVHRMRLYRRLMEKSTALYRQLSEHETLTSSYLPSFNRLGVDYSDEELINMEKDEVEELLRRSVALTYDEEWARGKTLVGPHRDEIVFFVNGRAVRDFGSQGQQRGVALALKLAQLALVHEISGNQPLLLLDDVMSELDEARRGALIQAIQTATQTIITATDLACFNETLLEDAQIIELEDTADRVRARHSVPDTGSETGGCADG
jgi:DNA replication and repair protein RecF